MRTLENIPRIKCPEASVFWRDYVLPQRPVIITNLFEGEPLAELNTLDRAREALGSMKLAVTEEYTQSLYKKLGKDDARPLAQRSEMTFHQYVEHVQAEPRTHLVCTELDTPVRVHGLMQVPSLCRRSDGPQDFLTNVFVANPGNYAHAHFDGDHRQVLLYQIFGRKRVTLIPPAQGKKLHPVYNTATVRLENMSDDDKIAFVQYANGYDAMLHPGDAIFMPMLIWHHLEYVDLAMSVNLRFGRNRYGRFLSADNMHMNMHLQTLATKFVDEARAAHEYGAAFEEIERAFYERYETRVAKLRRMQELFEELYSRCCPEALQGELSLVDLRELQEKTVLQLMEQTLLYGDATRPGTHTAQPITARQQEVVRAQARKRGVDDAALLRVVRNRYGTEGLDRLTTEEGSQLIAFLNSVSGAP